jgi:hypothetical protein
MNYPPAESLGSNWPPLPQQIYLVGLQKGTIRSSPHQFLMAIEVMVNGTLGRGRHSSPQQEMPHGLLERPGPGSPHSGEVILPVTDPNTPNLEEPPPPTSSIRDHVSAPLKVYFRKNLKHQQHRDQKEDQLFEEEHCEEDGDATGVSAPLMPSRLTQNGSDAEDDGLTGRSHKENFVNDICRRPSGILSVPENITQRQHPPPSTFVSASRRSRQVAGIGVEFQMQDLGSRSTKKSMRTLQIIIEYEGISQEAIEEYKKLFTHPLSQCHIEALSALFGWNTPPDLVFS